jgi:hypothetical protein
MIVCVNVLYYMCFLLLYGLISLHHIVEIHPGTELIMFKMTANSCIQSIQC